MREYVFLEATIAFCSECGKTVPGKLVEQGGSVYLLKYCPVHGELREVFEHDAAYHRRKRLYDKPGTESTVNRPLGRGCPYDCGLCPQHNQHTCIGLIEITDHCGLECPVCYAGAERKKNGHLSLAKVEEMLDFYIESEGGCAEILQISGGEPTAHPEILDILRMAKKKKIKCLMLNTNGIRIADDEAFADALQEFRGDFEVYLQFDGFGSDVYESLRGADLEAVKRRAVERLSSRGLPMTLVMTVQSSVNDHQLGEVFAYALKARHVRGINFQLATEFGRYEPVRRGKRETVSGAVEKLCRQLGGMMTLDDFIPLPCNVERTAITILYRKDGGFLPLTRNMPPEELVPVINNTFIFTVDELLKNPTFTAKSVLHCNCFDLVRKFLPVSLTPRNSAERMAFISDNFFRVSVHSFVDMVSFDLKSVQKECVHIVTPDLRRVPFSTYNMLHRQGGVEE